MTLILRLGLDMVKVYLYAEHELLNYSGSKVIAWTDRHTDLTEIITYPHTRMVNIPEVVDSKCTCLTHYISATQQLQQM